MTANKNEAWINSSLNLGWIDLLLIPIAQGLGILDVELTEEFPLLNLKSNLQPDLSKKCRHIVLSQLWVYGVYELIRFINDLNKERNMFSRETKRFLK